MRIFYADPGLVGNRGHHANSCRAITRVLEARGMEFRVLASHGIEKGLRDELKATPFFRVDPYQQTDGDPISGWLNAFSAAAPQTLNDFKQLSGIRNTDVIFLAFGLAPQLLGLGMWLAQQKNGPAAIMDLIMEPGLDVQKGPEGITAVLRDPRVDPRAVLYRFAGSQLNALKVQRLIVGTADTTASALYQHLLQRPVSLLPFPHTSEGAVRNRARSRPITLTLMGHQQPNKGFQLMPQILGQLLRTKADVRIVAHNSAPERLPDTQATLKAMARNDSRLVVDERELDPQDWVGLLDQTDIMVCPYQPEWYRVATSGVAAEAIARGIPIVAPEDTTLSRWGAEFGAVTTFAEFDSKTITAAIQSALKNFDSNAESAAAGAVKWSNVHSPAKYVDTLLTLAAQV